MQEQIYQLLAQAEQDTVVASDEAMRLMAEFGSDSLLMEFVATANQYKTDITTSKAKLQQLRQEVPSSERNLKFQILLAQVSTIRTSSGRFLERVREISRND